ncbi:MAG: hypothetical protein LBM72_03025, partial [Mycoplasmataceae bacterium]|nr:hypothetical protein [Mycoplasmataceae bacterium]
MNFGTVYKQTFKSTFSQVSTSILLVIFAILMAVLWLLVPALVMKDHSSQSFIVDFIKQFMFQMFYVCTMVS